MTTPDYQQALGRKIAAERRRRGLSQPELARMIDRSVAWVSQVERGVRKVDRMSVLETLAAALDIPLAELAAEAPVVAAVTEESPGAADLRLVLSGVYSLRALLNGRHDPPALADLRARTGTAWELTHAGRYTELASLLRGLVPDLETAARALPVADRAEASELMATTYQACSAGLAKLGEPEAAWIAADRAMAAAERAGNPLLVAAGAFRLVFVFLAARHYDQAEETARTTADALAHLASGDPQATSLWGGLTLQRAVIAACLNDPGAAYRHLEQASQAAARLGEGRNDHNTEFGPANVAVHEIAVAVELGDAGRALRAAATVDATGLSAERQARMLIDVARAHAQRRQVTEAIAAVIEAERISAELARSHEQVRQLVSDLVTMNDPPSAELRDLAARTGAVRLQI